MVTREEMMARAEGWRARKDEIQRQFAERVDAPSAEKAIGLSLVGAGVGTVVSNLIRRKRSPWAYVIPAILVLSGLAVMSSGAYGRRADRIAEAEEAVRGQLADLDPIARAQVLKEIAGETFAPYMHRIRN
jgi:hypothetical protein